MRRKKKVKKKVWRLVRRADYRSDYEADIAEGLAKAGVEFEYETLVLPYQESQPGTRCRECGGTNCFKNRRYKPDFLLPPDDGPVIEAKGNFNKDARKKMKLVKEQYPDINFYLMFMRNNKIYRTSRTRYSDWAEQHGFEYVIGTEVPREWIDQTVA